MHGNANIKVKKKIIFHAIFGYHFNFLLNEILFNHLFLKQINDGI